MQHFVQKAILVGMTIVLMSGGASLFADASILQSDVPHLCQCFPIAISPEGRFAIITTGSGNLARLDLESGLLTDLHVKPPNSHSHLTVFPNSNLIAYFDRSRHSVVTFDTKLAREVDVIPLPNHADCITALNVVEQPGNAPRLERCPLQGIPATGLWISRSGTTLAIAFRQHLVIVDVDSKDATSLPPVTLSGVVSSVAFSQNSRAAIISAPGGYRGMSIVDLTTHDRLFDIEGFNLERKRIPGTSRTFYSISHLQSIEVAWSPNDAYIASIVSTVNGDSIRFWDGTTGNALSTWSRRGVTIDTVEITAAGDRCLAIAKTRDRDHLTAISAVLIDIRSGEEVSTVNLPHGELRAKGSGHGKIFLYDGSETAFYLSVSGE